MLFRSRLKLLEVNCAEPFDHSVLHDVSWLAKRSGAELREMGRLAHPMRRRRGDKGFRRIDWDEALDAIAGAITVAGGDRSAVTAGTRVISDRIKVRVTQEPGQGFLDRMIALVEGAERQKTPNEIALTILLVGLTIIFLIADRKSTRLNSSH